MKDVVCKYCQSINKHHSFKCFYKPKKETVSKPKNQIAKFSDKKLIELKQYRKLRDEYFKLNPICEAKLLNCTYNATDIHHKAGKVGKLFLDVKYFCSLCRSCHSYLEVNPKFAKENGFSLDRLDK